MDVPLQGLLAALLTAFGLEDIHLQPLPVLHVQVVAVSEAHRLLVGGRLEAHPGEHAAHLRLGLVGHRSGHVGQLAAKERGHGGCRARRAVEKQRPDGAAGRRCGGRDLGAGKRAAAATAAGGSAEPLPPLPSAGRAAALRAALGHATAAESRGPSRPAPRRSAPFRRSLPDGGCHRAAVVTGLRLSPDGGCHQPTAVSGRPAQTPGRENRVSIAVRPPRGEKRRERIAAFLGEVPAAPAKPSLPPPGMVTPTPAGPRRQRRSAAPPAPQPPATPDPQPRSPAPSPFPPRTEQQRENGPTEGADRRLSTDSQRISPPRSPPLIIFPPKTPRTPLGTRRQRGKHRHGNAVAAPTAVAPLRSAPRPGCALPRTAPRAAPGRPSGSAPSAGDVSHFSSQKPIFPFCSPERPYLLHRIHMLNRKALREFSLFNCPRGAQPALHITATGDPCGAARGERRHLGFGPGGKQHRCGTAWGSPRFCGSGEKE